MEHIHSGVLVSGYPATCTEAGYKDYYECSCGRYFEDSDCLIEITDIAAWEVIPPTGHSYSTLWMDEAEHWLQCDCGARDSVEAHVFSWMIDKAATATETGLKHEECSFCGYQKPGVVIPVIETEDTDDDEEEDETEDIAQSTNPAENAKQEHTVSPKTGDSNHFTTSYTPAYVFQKQYNTGSRSPSVYPTPAQKNNRYAAAYGRRSRG